MKTSDLLDKIAPALLAAQADIGNAAKNSKNPHFRNDYANLESVIEAVKGPLNKHGITVLQGVGEVKDGVLSVTTRLLHSSGQWLEETSSSPIPKPDPQGVGSTVTYLRRYSASGLLFLTQTDDDGEGARHDATPAPAKLTKDQLSTLAGLQLQDTATAARIGKGLEFYKVKGIEDLSSEQAATIIKKVTS
jgi:hypothetical protein